VSTRSLWIVSGVGLLVGAAASLAFGAVEIPIARLPGLIWASLSGGEPSEPLQATVLWNLRMPRTLLGIIIGAVLGVSGALTQGWFRNPLADPGLLGISQGATLATAIGLLWGISPGFFAIIGGFAAAFVVHLIGRDSGGGGVARLILAGIAVNAIAGAGLGLLLTLADDTALRDLTFWTLGSLGNASWSMLTWVFPLLLLPTLLSVTLSGKLDALLLGEATAHHLGIDLSRTRLQIIGLVSWMMGIAVSVSGLIGFVGLAAPHVVRMWTGPRHSVLLPGSALFGAAIVVSADAVARNVALPLELPLGAITTLIGGPVFLHLLYRSEFGR